MMVCDGMPAYPVHHLVLQVDAAGTAILDARLHVWSARLGDFDVADFWILDAR